MIAVDCHQDFISYALALSNTKKLLVINLSFFSDALGLIIELLAVIGTFGVVPSEFATLLEGETFTAQMER